MSHFFPAPEAIVNDLGPAAAVLYGRIWRYCQGGGVCFATLATLASECNVNERTVRRWVARLAADGYITHESGKASGKTNCITTTTKWVMGGVGQDVQGVGQNVQGGRTNSPTGVGQNVQRLKDVEEKTEDKNQETTSTSKTPLPPTLPAGQPGDQDATRTVPTRATGKASRVAAERPRDPAFDAFMGAFPTAAGSQAAKFSKLVKGKAAPGDWDAWLRDVREDRAKGYVKAHNACELFLAWLDTRHGSSAADPGLDARMQRLGAPDNWRDIVYAPGGVKRSPVLALPRMGLEPYAQQGDWPAWYRAFEGAKP